MRAGVYHVQLNVTDAAVPVPFYRLLGYLEYRVLVGSDGLLGMSNGTTDVWIVQAAADRAGRAFHRRNPGLKHLAFRVTARGGCPEKPLADRRKPHGAPPRPE